jgi:simple sugar transport system ATP-binding protein
MISKREIFPMNSSIIELRHISKSYTPGGRMAVNDVSLDIRPGEILCIAGENGAGKTTLMRILDGILQPSSGEIYIDGKAVAIQTPADARRFGIGMVHQHFMLFPHCSAAQNVVMGNEPRRFGIFYDLKRANSIVQEMIEQSGFSISASQQVQDMSAGQKQQTEILRLLYQKARVLILDEPTSVLGEREAESLFETLRSLAASGKAVLLITHKMDDVQKIAARVVFLRRGEVSEDITNPPPAPPKGRGERGMLVPPPLAGEAGRGKAVLSYQSDTLTFTLHAGEVLGLSADKNLEAALSGFRPQSSARLFFRGADITQWTSEKLRRIGMAYVPSDRTMTGGAMEATLRENAIISKRRELFRRHATTEYAQKLLAQYGIEAAAEQKLQTLSGGNIQRLILGREMDVLDERPDGYLVLSEPASGLDVAATGLVYAQIRHLAEKGAAVILFSSDPDELLALSDRIIVLQRGRIKAAFSKGVTKAALSAAMTGVL